MTFTLFMKNIDHVFSLLHAILIIVWKFLVFLYFHKVVANSINNGVKNIMLKIYELAIFLFINLIIGS